ncbi:response regulator [Desulfobulbus alkaliphilus]|uniref:response regulator n=1 Tax=Desulfobulbus alkaliphilus TaxID=869814 RepID=UPI001963A25F|nr:response regulator transcription factor [Desulfobulbus alkaliphilus]MBM9537236.1 response regulator transcription factor [Desulfobulbus alkaliphilus]
MKPYRIIIADDHGLIRQGLKSILKKDPTLQVIAEASNGVELLDLLQQDQPEMIILDISMPRLNGIEALGRIRKAHAHIAILILTMHSSSHYVFHAVNAGAHGYMMKDDSEAELLTAISSIKEGKTYISPQVSSGVAEEVIVAFRGQSKIPFEVLSKREEGVLKLVVQGLSSKEIAKLLKLSPRTIDHHRANLLKKFKMKKTVDLVNHVVSTGVVAPR